MIAPGLTNPEVFSDEKQVNEQSGNGDDMTNPEKTSTAVSAGIAVLAVGLIFLPGWIGMDGMNGGYAVSFVSLFIAISAAIVALFFRGRAAALDNIFAGKNLLAHWTYQPAEWQSYADSEFHEQTELNKGLLWVIAAWALFFGGLCWLIDRDGGRFVLFLMVGLILLLATVAFGLPRLRYLRQRRGPGDAWITPTAIYFDGNLLNWNSWGTRLESVGWRDPKGNVPALLEFMVSYIARTGRQSQTLRIPVPSGREAEARTVLSQFS